MLLDEQVVTGEIQLKKISAFLQTHHNNLDVVLSKFLSVDGGNNRDYHSILISASRCTMRSHPGSSVGLDFSFAVESVRPTDLIQTNNKCLNKTIAVFVQLCVEVQKLIKEGGQLMVKCLLANEELSGILQKNGSHHCSIPSPINQNKCEEVNEILLSPEMIRKIGSFLGMLFQTQQFIDRNGVVISEIVKQFSALFDIDTGSYINVDYSSLHFQTVFNYLSEAVILFIKFDCIFQESELQQIWPQYMKSIKIAEQNIDVLTSRSSFSKKSFGLNDVTGLRNILSKVDCLLSGTLFQNLLDGICCDQTNNQMHARSVSQFNSQYCSFLRNTLNVVQKHLNNTSNTSRNSFISPVTAGNISILLNGDDISNDQLLNISCESPQDASNLVLKLNAMCILYHHLFGNLDQRLFATVIETNAKFPCLLITENIIWSPERFLSVFGATLISKMREKKISLDNIGRIQQQWLQTKCQRLFIDISLNTVQIATYILRIRSEFGCDLAVKPKTQVLSNFNHIKIADYNRKVLLILQGIDFMETFNNTINTVTNLHVYIKCPMTKQCILSVAKLIELVKLLKFELKKYSNEMFNTILCLCQHQIYQALLIILYAKKNFQSSSLMSSSAYNERTVDILSALELSQSALVGSPNVQRILIARLALTMSDPRQVFQVDQLTKICRLFASIERLIQTSNSLRLSSSDAYMCRHQVAILPTYSRHAISISKAADCEKIQYLYEPIEESHYDSMCEADNIHFSNSEKHTNDTRSILKEHLIANICSCIEMKLRLDVHENLQLLQTENINPFSMCESNQSNDIPEEDVLRVLSLKLFPLLHLSATQAYPTYHYLSIRDQVNRYLSQMFYNLTTISLHNWRTYGQMRILAKRKFHLETVEDHLPTQTLEQGLDVLEIMRNIHLFVSNYLYNLNNQVFIEKNSKNKHLNTINIRHIANSLKTHGIGIINTTVNFTYQFLHKKLYIFSQFLYNEHIQSRLLKDLKSFREANLNISEDQQMYSYERANSVNKGIRQLGLSKNGQSSLDLFRQLITHIGNAMGYIRMMRSGGIHCCSNANVFLGMDNEKLQFIEKCEKNLLLGSTQHSAENLENEIVHLTHNYAEATEYFQLLVNAFSSFFQNDKNPHIKIFYLIVPALILNYIEYIVAVKENLNKKTKELGVTFTDDGFAMGAVRQKFSVELVQLQKANEENGAAFSSSNNLYDAKLHQTLALSEKRINTIRHEFDLLYYSLNSAKIFFQ